MTIRNDPHFQSLTGNRQIEPGAMIDSRTRIGHWLGALARCFSRPCLLCGLPSHASLCPGCDADLPRTRASCPQCALPTPDGALCGACLRDPPAFDAAIAAFAYGFPIDRLVQALKYAHRLECATVLGEALAAAAAGRSVDRIVPMPMHAARLRERGFNQASEIARALKKHAGPSQVFLGPSGGTERSEVAGDALQFIAPIEPLLCERRRDTPPQAGLDRDARRRNLRGAFACTARLDGLSVAVVDDVMTTGSSMRELALTLKQAGAARVEAWVVARAARSP
jgi:predicted amidophosphoribosyltransferase